MRLIANKRVQYLRGYIVTVCVGSFTTETTPSLAEEGIDFKELKCCHEPDKIAVVITVSVVFAGTELERYDSF